jgi:hypothetical protein
MNSIIISGGIRYFINNQEHSFLNEKKFPLDKKTLSENEMVIASNLYKRGILDAYRKNDNFYYIMNEGNI